MKSAGEGPVHFGNGYEIMERYAIYMNVNHKGTITQNLLGWKHGS